MKNKLIALIVALLSAGWLFPLWLGIYTYLSFWQSEGWPLLQGKHPGNSFPFLPFATNCFLTALLWLGIVIFFWSFLGYLRFLRSRAT